MNIEKYCNVKRGCPSPPGKKALDWPVKIRGRFKPFVAGEFSDDENPDRVHPFTATTFLIIPLTVFHTILVILVQRNWHWIKC